MANAGAIIPSRRRSSHPHHPDRALMSRPFAVVIATAPGRNALETELGPAMAGRTPPLRTRWVTSRPTRRADAGVDRRPLPIDAEGVTAGSLLLPLTGRRVAGHCRADAFGRIRSRAPRRSPLSPGRQLDRAVRDVAPSKAIVSGGVDERLLMGGSSSAVSDALGAAPPSPVVGSCRDDRLLSAAALGLSKHEVAATLATASPDGAPAAVADRDGVAVLAPADFCAVGRVQQSRAAHDAASARPQQKSA